MTTLSSTSPAVLAVLLDALADALPGPKAPRWETEGQRGFARSWVVCPKCEGSGQATWKGRTVKCDRLHCNGQGGWAGDPMAEHGHSRPIEPHAVGHDQTVSEFYALLRDMDLPAKERLSRAIDVAVNGLDVTLTDRVRAQHPCFAQLEQALTAMRHNEFRYHWAVLVRRHLLGLPTADDHDGELYEDALHMLAVTLDVVCAPRGFHAPQWAKTAADARLKADRERKTVAQQKADRWPDRDARAREARRLATQGRSVRQIAKDLGVSKSVIGRDLAA